MQQQQLLGQGLVEPQVREGVSWSQAVMCMHLICLNDIGMPPA
jgi:hypothetical protein